MERHARARRRIWIAVAAGLAGVASAGWSGKAGAQLHTRWTIDPKAAAQGQQDFAASCSFCHGSDARGSARAPDLVRSELVSRDEHGELIGQVVLHGRSDKGMPAFPALADKIPDIAMFLHAQLEAVMNRFAYPMQVTGTGDPRAGERFFNGSGRCASCHSPTGDLAGIAKKYKPDRLQGMIAYPGPTIFAFMGLNIRPVDNPPVAVTVTLPSGKSIAGTAVFLGEYDVSLRDADGAYRSFARGNGIQVEVKDPMEAHRQLIGAYNDAEMHNLLAYLMELK